MVECFLTFKVPGFDSYRQAFVNMFLILKYFVIFSN